MKGSTTGLFLATLSLAMVIPAFGQTSAQSAQDNQTDGLQQAQQMVAARAALTSTLDARSIHPGDKFRATISENVHLNGGTELHKGDALLGEVVTDDMNTPGNSRIAVRFTEADLKNGQTIPVKATIVAIYTPSQLLTNNEYGEADQFPNSWTDGTLSVDQLGVVSGVDLHSRIASQNSGVFVSTTKKDVKIPGGSEIALAIATQGNSTSTATGD